MSRRTLHLEYYFVVFSKCLKSHIFKIADSCYISNPKEQKKRLLNDWIHNLWFLQGISIWECDGLTEDGVVGLLNSCPVNFFFDAFCIRTFFLKHTPPRLKPLSPRRSTQEGRWKPTSREMLGVERLQPLKLTFAHCRLKVKAVCELSSIFSLFSLFTLMGVWGKFLSSFSDWRDSRNSKFFLTSWREIAKFDQMQRCFAWILAAYPFFCGIWPQNKKGLKFLCVCHAWATVLIVSS